MTSSRSAVSGRPVSGSIPACAGIGLRAPHHERFACESPAAAWVEVHSENFFVEGGPQLDLLSRVRDRYPLSLHGVGLALGSSDPLDCGHLKSLRRLVDRFEPGLVSEHLCWALVDRVHFNDLLPLPYTEEALVHVVSRIGQAQDYLRRRILIENLSSYLDYNFSTIPEWEFLSEVARRSGCGILLDVNNIYVSSRNIGFNAYDYVVGVPADLIEEIHLAGHSINKVDNGEVFIDTHNDLVAGPVWDLYFALCSLVGSVPTLIEWDTDLPPLEVLLAEAARADKLRNIAHAIAA